MVNILCSFKFAIFILLLVSGALHGDGRSFRFDYAYYPEIEGWLKLHRVPATWHDARLRCSREGAVLASPINRKLLTAMNNLSSEFLTGVHATISKGYYFSIEGVPLDRMPITWAPGEPDNCDNSEECLLQSNGQMADVKCSDVFPFICYKKRTKSMVISGCGTTDSEYTQHSRTGSCYKFHRLGRPWSQAFSTCAAEGAHLAIINSDAEANILKDLYAKHPDHTITANVKNVALVGFYDWGDHGVWNTIHGQSLEEAGYSSWSKDQPDNATAGQFCGAIYRNALFDDMWCHLSAPFICEKSPESLLTDDFDV